MKLKCLFGKHKKIPYKREFIGYGRAPNQYGLDRTFQFITYSKCFFCGKSIKTFEEGLWCYAEKQPYDVNYPDDSTN